MKNLAILLLLLGVPAAVSYLVLKGDGNHAAQAQSFTVARGDLIDVLREVGELASQDPLLLQAPFEGEIKWLVEDGTWVEADAETLIFDEEALVQTVSDLRATVIEKRQAIRLRKLQADHARIAERQRVDNAKQDLMLAQIRHRILTTPPRGGDQLVQLDEEIQPLEQQLKDLQDKLSPLEKAFRESRDAYQAALQVWQESRSRLLEIRMGKNLDKSSARTEVPPTDTATQTIEVDPLEAAKAEANSRQRELDDARAAHDVHRIPYEAAIAEIDAADLEAQELYILIEIEKRGLPATRLAIDRDIAKLRLAESQRKVETGKRALTAGALSQSRYDQLVADMEASTGQLEILEYRLEIASRPATEDEVATSEATLSAAQRAVDNAEKVFQREMDIIQSDIAVLEAELAAAIGTLDRNGRGFPDAIEGTIKMLAAELDLLAAEDSDRRTNIETEIQTLNAELVNAKKRPPNIVRAPTAGLVRLREQDDRLTDVGDKWDKGETVAMLYPPGNMRVKAGINEANFQRVQPGMPCVVEIPALSLTIEDAEVSHISRIGRDRVQSESRWEVVSVSGIVEFSLTVDLKREVDGFRQGMTVLLGIETDRQSNVLYLPAAAVRETPEGGFDVQISEDPDSLRPVEGHYFGDDAFLITAGLSEGERVYRMREAEEAP